MESKLYIPNFEAMEDISKNKSEFVLQDWVSKLNFKHQTGLISAIRGYDHDERETFGCGFKEITKMVRGIVLKNADNKTSFMRSIPLDKTDVVDTLVLCAAEYQKEWHWLNHIVMAMHTIALYHNNEYVKLYYKEICTKYASDMIRTVKKPIDEKPYVLNEVTSSDLKSTKLEVSENEVPKCSDMDKEDSILKVASDHYEGQYLIGDNSHVLDKNLYPRLDVKSAHQGDIVDIDATHRGDISVNDKTLDDGILPE